jgi:hypothetical protein
MAATCQARELTVVRGHQAPALDVNYVKESSKRILKI